MSTHTEDVQMAYDADASGFVLTVDGELAGVAEVLRGNGVMIVTHTEIVPELGGLGLAKVLLARALADVAAQDLAVEARCHLAATCLMKNPDAARRTD